MAVWVRGRTYQLLYENGREEAVWRVRTPEEQAAVDGRAAAQRAAVAGWPKLGTLT